jgi:hypothetical protein
MIITVFGTGSSTKEEDEVAYELGKKIALAGHVLKNRGYSGTMKASAKGCKDYGGTSIGVCVKGHSFATEGKPNEYLTEVIETNSLTERVTELLKADKIVVLPGKIGTLSELFRTWAEYFTSGKGKIYLIGEKNKRLVNFLLENDFFSSKKYLEYIEQVDSINDLDFLEN